jgi:hypothetical protein
MNEEKEQNPKGVSGGAGIAAGGDVNFGGVSGQFAVGNNNTLTQTITQTISGEDKKVLNDNLQQFQKEIAKMNLPADEAANVNSNINLAVKEAQKDQPDPKKIQNKFQGAIDTIKEVGDIQAVSNWDKTKKILEILGKIGLKILL